jgi:hypothetical protein
MAMTDDRFVCPVCGYDCLYEAPWNDGVGSDEICPSCGTHFGYDDMAGGDAARREARHRELRSRWIDGGCRWFSRTRQPPEYWDPHTQRSIFEE